MPACLFKTNLIINYNVIYQAYFNYTKRVKLLKTKLETVVGSMPTDSPIPSPDINAPSPSTSSVSIEDINVQNLNYDSIPKTDNYTSSENGNNTTEIYIPTTVVSNIKSFVTTESYNTVQGWLIKYLQTLSILVFKKYFIVQNCMIQLL